MYKRKAASLSAAFVCGAAASEYGFMLLFYTICGLPLLAYIALLAKKGEKPFPHIMCFLAALAAAAALGSGISISRQAYFEFCESRLDGGRECMLQGTIYKKQQDGESCLYYLKKCRVRQNRAEYPCVNVLAHLEVLDYSIGEILILNGNLKPFLRPQNEGGYDEKNYYQSLNFGFHIYATKASAVYGRRDVFREWLYSFKEKMKKSYMSAMPKADAGVLTAMVLGDKGQMDANRKQIYQNAGISHFYSISGLHISLLGMALYSFLAKRGFPYLIACPLAFVWILAYGQLIGFGISASRAIGMFLLLMYAKCRGRSYDPPTALALLAAFLAAQNPAILQNAGYLLSFGAATGVMMAKYLQEAAIQKKPVRGGLYKGLCEAFRVSVCIQLITVPVLCQFFYEIPVYAALLNLVVLPCMGALLGIGLLGGITGCFFPLAANRLLYPCHLLLLLFESACNAALSLPGAVFVTGRLSAIQILLWYGCIALFLYFAGNRVHLQKAGVEIPPGLRQAKPSWLWNFILLPFLIILLIARPAARFEIDILDVGQGDGIYISPGDGTSLFIDGGSTDVKSVGIYRILPFLKCRGIRSIDYWFVSHCDADHINGLYEVLEAGYQVKNLAVSEYMPDDKASRRLKRAAARHKIPLLVMGGGDAIKGENGKWALKSLSQKSDTAQAGRNGASLILLYESVECRAFFGGDIGKGQEEALAAQGGLSQIDVYKASHHGSDTSNGDRLLQALKPDIAVISCGLYNAYGHPGKEAVGNMERAGAEVYETRYGGQVKIDPFGCFYPMEYY